MGIDNTSNGSNLLSFKRLKEEKLKYDIDQHPKEICGEDDVVHDSEYEPLSYPTKYEGDNTMKNFTDITPEATREVIFTKTNSSSETKKTLWGKIQENKAKIIKYGLIGLAIIGGLVTGVVVFNHKDDKSEETEEPDVTVTEF